MSHSRRARSTSDQRRHTFRRLMAELLEQRSLLTVITSVAPLANSHAAATATEIRATFDADVLTAAATPQNFVVHGTQTQGRLMGATTAVSSSGPVIRHDPVNPFAAGETIEVTATTGIATTSGAAVPRVWQFRTASGGSGEFVDGGKVLGNNTVEQVSLGDVDGDSDLDAVLAGMEIWFNDGSGGFTDSGQNLGLPIYSHGADLADVDGDGDLDLVSASRLALNDGNGIFTNTGQILGVGSAGSATLGDFDADGDLDVITGVPYEPNRVFFNDGAGRFTDSGQLVGNGATDAVVIGDFDSDGDLDAFEALNGTANKVWFNDGSGNFTDSGQALGGFRATKDADPGDVDGDGDLDLVVGNVFGNVGARIYLNDGSGVFSDSGQAIGGVTSELYRVRLADMDGDGDLDVYASQRSVASEIWLNDGMGQFSDTGQRLSFSGSRQIDGAEIGDLDGDGDMDLVETNFTPVGGGRVWFNQTLTPDVTLSIDQTELAEAGGQATITATLSAAFDQAVRIELAFSGSAQSGDYIASATEIIVPVGATSAAITVTAVQDQLDEEDETVIVEITNIENGQGAGQVTVTIIDDADVPATFQVSSLNATGTGFQAAFNAAVDESQLNLFDTESGGLGPADIVLLGSDAPVAGSVVVSGSGRVLQFIATGERLAPGTYSVAIRSAENGLRDTAGNLLDGNADGTPGDDYNMPFEIAASSAVELSIPDFMRGPGQAVEVPHGSAGLPLRINDGTGVRTATVSLDFDPNLLIVTGATVGATLPAGTTVNIDTSTLGRAIISITSPTDLPPGPSILADLQASVPATNASQIYRELQILDLHSVALTGGAGEAIASIDNDAIHVAAFMADLSGNGRINATDASQTARLAALVDGGVLAFSTVDPLVVADSSGNGRINAADASLVAQVAALIPVPGIPPIPSGVVIAAAGGIFQPGPQKQVVAAFDSQTPRSTASVSSDGVTLLIAPREDWPRPGAGRPTVRELVFASKLDDVATGQLLASLSEFWE